MWVGSGVRSVVSASAFNLGINWQEVAMQGAATEHMPVELEKEKQKRRPKSQSPDGTSESGLMDRVRTVRSQSGREGNLHSFFYFAIDSDKV